MNHCILASLLPLNHQYCRSTTYRFLVSSLFLELLELEPEFLELVLPEFAVCLEPLVLLEPAVCPEPLVYLEPLVPLGSLVLPELAVCPEPLVYLKPLVPLGSLVLLEPAVCSELSLFGI